MRTSHEIHLGPTTDALDTHVVIAECHHQAPELLAPTLMGRLHADFSPTVAPVMWKLRRSHADDVLIVAKDLVNGTSIARAVPAGIRDIEYFHIELDAHEVVLAEGAHIETLLLTDGRESFTNCSEYERLYGQEVGRAVIPYAPVLGYSHARAHLKALLRLGVSQVIDVRDPTQVANNRIAARATCLPV